jgi:hypothetical protein
MDFEIRKRKVLGSGGSVVSYMTTKLVDTYTDHLEKYSMWCIYN